MVENSYYHRFLFPIVNGEIRHCWYDEIAALDVFFYI
jgi:hypothetical protein